MDSPQGDLQLLDSDIARRLLNSTVPARLGFVALDGTPRVVPTWHVWTGEELVMSTFLACPGFGIERPAYRVAALRARPDVAVTIDTEVPPPPQDVLMLRGEVSITEVDGLTAEHTEAAVRFCGEEGGRAYLAAADVPGTRMARCALRPRWVGVLGGERSPDVMQG